MKVDLKLVKMKKYLDRKWWVVLDVGVMKWNVDVLYFDGFDISFIVWVD